MKLIENDAQAGRELDSVIAEKLMAYQCTCNEPPGVVDCPIHNKDDRNVLLPYSTDIASAWQVIERLQQLNHITHLEIYCGITQTAYAISATVRGAEGHSFYGGASTAPLAICRAALNLINAE